MTSVIYSVSFVKKNYFSFLLHLNCLIVPLFLFHISKIIHNILKLFLFILHILINLNVVLHFAFIKVVVFVPVLVLVSSTSKYYKSHGQTPLLLCFVKNFNSFCVNVTLNCTTFELPLLLLYVYIIKFKIPNVNVLVITIYKMRKSDTFVTTEYQIQR